ncbi:MAG: NAD(P)-binding domain-containing protein, partial [Mycobacterium sp.]
MNHNTTGGSETDGPRRVGFIGLGNMGSAMALRLIEAGYHVTVWARTASKVDALVERGAARGQDPEDAIGTGVVFSMLSNDDA